MIRGLRFLFYIHPVPLLFNCSQLHEYQEAAESLVLHICSDSHILSLERLGNLHTCTDFLSLVCLCITLFLIHEYLCFKKSVLRVRMGRTHCDICLNI